MEYDPKHVAKAVHAMQTQLYADIMSSLHRAAADDAARIERVAAVSHEQAARELRELSKGSKFGDVESV